MKEKNKLFILALSVLSVLTGLYFTTSILDKLEYSFLNYSSKLIAILICTVYIIYITFAKINHIKKSYKNYKINRFLFLFFFILLLSNIYILLYTPYKAHADFIALFQLLIMSFVILSINFSKKNIFNITKIWFICSIIIAIIIIIYNIDNINRNKILFLNGYYDPNLLSASLIPALLIATYYTISKDKNKYFRITCFISFLLVLLSIIITGSRGSLIAALVGIIFLLFPMLKNSQSTKNIVHSKFKISILLIGIGVFICAIIYLVPQETLTRFNPVRLMMDGGSARIQIWSKALNIFLNSNLIKIIFGFGTGTFKYIAGTNIVQADGWVSANIASHNIFIRVLFENGFLGLFILILIFYFLIITFIKNKEVLSLSITISYLVIGMTLDLTITRFFWNAILFTILSSNTFVNKTNNSNVEI